MRTSSVCAKLVKVLQLSAKDIYSIFDLPEDTVLMTWAAAGEWIAGKRNQLNIT